MRITEVYPEAVDPIEANTLDDFSEVKIFMAEANVLKTHIKVNQSNNYQGNNYQGNNYQGNHGLYNNPCRGYHQGNNYGNN